MKTNFLACFLSLQSLFTIGQTTEQKKISLAFVFYEHTKTNIIVIPNTERYHSFRIFRKLRSDSSYTFITEQKKPLLPMRYNPTPYGISWEDKDFHTKDIDYKIIAYNKKGTEIGELEVVWDKASPPKSE